MFPRKVDTPFMGTTNKAYYQDCLKAGVRILERGGEFIHCKTLVADDAVSIVGASNLDWRSFYVNYEINTIIYDRETAVDGKEIFLSDTMQTREVKNGSWSRFMRLFYRLL